MSMGTNPRYIEELRIGGGYDDPADGGADIEKNGNISTNGNLTADGNLSAGSPDAEDHSVSVTAGANNDTYLNLFQGGSNNGGAVWYDGSANKLRVGARNDSQTPLAAIEIEKGTQAATVLGDLNIHGAVSVNSMNAAGLVKNNADGDLIGGCSLAAADLPAHNHTAANQGGDYAWADITALGSSGASTAVSRDDHVQAVAKGGTGLTATPADGQLPIGKTAANGFALATLTGTPNRVSVANGSGTITLSAPQDLHADANPTFNNMTLNGRLTQTGNYQGVSTEGLLALWHCENANTLQDWAGNGNTLTGVNSPALVAGKYGNAVSFAASNQYFSGTSSIPDAYGQANMSYSFWCCGAPGADTKHNMPWYADGAHYLDFLFQSNGTLIVRVHGGGAFRDISSGISIADGKWHHVVYTRAYVSPNNSTFTLYIDGEQRGTISPADVDDIALATTTIHLGHPWGGSTPFTFDEVSIWSRTLSAAEAKSLYLQNKELADPFGNVLTAGNATIAGTLAINGNSLTSGSASFNLLNTGVTNTLNVGGAAATVNIGAGALATVNLRAAVVDTSQNTIVFMATPGTMNFAQGAAAVSIGADTGMCTVNNATLSAKTIEASGNLTLSKSNIQISVNLPTSNPGPGKLWNDGGFVKVGS